ncbi:MAG TPA: hypothetical protein VIN09_10620 [Chloroflexota bacterium]
MFHAVIEQQRRSGLPLPWPTRFAGIWHAPRPHHLLPPFPLFTGWTEAWGGPPPALGLQVRLRQIQEARSRRRERRP